MIITGKKFCKPKLSRVINGDDVIDSGPTRPDLFRLDHLMVEQFTDYNRSTLQNFIKGGYVQVDGKVVVKPNAKFEKIVQIELELPVQSQISKYQPQVIYEDEHVLVLDKPVGMLSMKKGEYTPEETLEDYGTLVHRLDRGTSGVVILAKDEDTRAYLQKQFQKRTAHKTYYAVVVGHPKEPQAKIDLPIARNLKRPTTFKVDPAGKSAQTEYAVIAANDNYSLLGVHPTTGRTHQIRVHLSYIGTPILGDEVYGQTPADRLYLHASMLEITIPGGERRQFIAELPTEFDQKVGRA